MQPKQRIIGREAAGHSTLTFHFGQELRTVPGQVTADEIVYVVVQLRHCILEPEEVPGGFLGGIVHELGAEGAVLWQLVCEPAGYERQISP